MTEHDLNTAAELTRLREVNAELLEALQECRPYINDVLMARMVGDILRKYSK